MALDKEKFGWTPVYPPEHSPIVPARKGQVIWMPIQLPKYTEFDISAFHRALPLLGLDKKATIQIKGRRSEHVKGSEKPPQTNLAGPGESATATMAMTFTDHESDDGLHEAYQRQILAAQLDYLYELFIDGVAIENAARGTSDPSKWKAELLNQDLKKGLLYHSRQKRKRVINRSEFYTGLYFFNIAGAMFSLFTSVRDTLHGNAESAVVAGQNMGDYFIACALAFFLDQLLIREGGMTDAKSWQQEKVRLLLKLMNVFYLLTMIWQITREEYFKRSYVLARKRSQK